MILWTVLSLGWLAGLLFYWALCKVAGDADDRSWAMKHFRDTDSQRDDHGRRSP